jgi:hypothetical protein
MRTAPLTRRPAKTEHRQQSGDFAISVTVKHKSDIIAFDGEGTARTTPRQRRAPPIPAIKVFPQLLKSL